MAYLFKRNFCFSCRTIYTLYHAIKKRTDLGIGSFFIGFLDPVSDNKDKVY